MAHLADMPGVVMGWYVDSFSWRCLLCPRRLKGLLSIFCLSIVVGDLVVCWQRVLSCV